MVAGAWELNAQQLVQGALVRARRELLGLDQQTLGRALSMGQSSVARIEAGLQSLPPVRWRRGETTKPAQVVADVLRWSVDEMTQATATVVARVEAMAAAEGVPLKAHRYAYTGVSSWTCDKLPEAAVRALVGWAVALYTAAAPAPPPARRPPDRGAADAMRARARAGGVRSTTTKAKPTRARR